MNSAKRFSIDPEGVCVIMRSVAGLGAAILAFAGPAVASGALIIACVWADFGIGRLRKHSGISSPNALALEPFADLTDFVMAPMAFTIALAGLAPLILVGLAIFFVAANYRLARFAVEGLRDDRYVGLPVTYNGYIFPAAGIVGWLMPSLAGLIFFAVLLAVAGLMISRRLTVPEF
jgi:phosphatidylserine synthase